MTRTAPFVVLALIGSAVLATAATVHVHADDGPWTEVPATEEGGIVSFLLTPELAAGGRARVVINKPDWMVLDDSEAPRVTAYAVAGEITELGPGASIDLGSLTPETTRIRLDLADNANPLDTASVRLRVAGGEAATVQVLEDDPQTRSAVVELDLSALGPGAYAGTITVTDLSPQANRAELPVRFSVFGVEIAADQQSIRLAPGGASFTVQGDGRRTVVVDANGVAAHPSIQLGGDPFIYVRGFRRVTELAPLDGWQMIEAEADLVDIDGNDVTDEQVGTHVVLIAAAHPDLPVVVVQTEVTNLGEAREAYVFWGWLPGANYVTPDGETHEWSMTYQDFSHPGWVYIAPQRAGDPGVGWIAPDVFGESRFGTMIVYTDPKKVPLASGETLRTTFALMPANSPDDVRAAAQALARSALEEFAGIGGE